MEAKYIDFQFSETICILYPYGSTAVFNYLFTQSLWSIWLGPGPTIGCEGEQTNPYLLGADVPVGGYKEQ